MAKGKPGRLKGRYVALECVGGADRTDAYRVASDVKDLRAAVAWVRDHGDPQATYQPASLMGPEIRTVLVPREDREIEEVGA
jgi:hypothetical protein